MPPEGDLHEEFSLARSSPEMEIAPNTILRVGPRDVPADRWIVRQRIAGFGEDPSAIELENIRTHQKMFLTDAELAELAGRDHLHLLVGSDGSELKIPSLRAIVDEEEQAYRARCLAYVTGCKDLPRSRAKINPKIREIGNSLGDPETPGFTTVMLWLDAYNENYERFGDGCFERKPKSGNVAKRVLVGDVRVACNDAIVKTVMIAKGTARDALSFMREWFVEHRPGMDVPPLPAERTINREIRRLNGFVAEDLKYGTNAAVRKYKADYERPRPKLPLMEVEVDHSRLSILLFDETREILFGRPDIITFRDRCTGCILGMSIGFEEPSYASFLTGLEHTFFAKDMSEYPAVKNPWFCYGRPKMLLVDNALHFIGHNIRHAAKNLGIELVEFLPGTPWLKGAEEGLFKILERNVQNLPGSVFSNVEERKRYAETGDLPILTLSELRAFLTYWVCDVYHPNPHEGLAELRTLRDIPQRLWCTKIGSVRMALPPPRLDFGALAGDFDFRAVTSKGVRWDHIRYGSDELHFLRTHPEHRTGKEEKGWEGRRYQGSRYRVIRHPSDIGRITVVNPYKDGPRAFEVPAVRLDYAEGLALYQHKVFVSAQQRAVIEAVEEREDVLIEARDAITLGIAALKQARKKYDIQRKLARFQYAESENHRRSVVSTESYSEAASSSLMDPTSPRPLAKPATRSSDAAQITPVFRTVTSGASTKIATSSSALPKKIDPGGAAPKHVEAQPACTKPFDPEELRRRMKEKDGWKHL